MVNGGLYRDLIIITVSQIFTLCAIWFKEYYLKNKKYNTQLSPIDRSELFMRLTHICGQIKNDLNANGVYIAYLHNGDYYKNGMSIDKFTVVAEDYDTVIGISYISKYQFQIINYITYIYHRLLTDGRCYNINIPTLKMLDGVYKEDCIKRNVFSTYSFLIKDADERPIGFISLEYCYEYNFKKEYESCIWKHQLSISKSIKNITSKQNCNNH